MFTAQVKRKTISAATLSELSAQYGLLRDKSGQGASRFPDAIVFEDGRQIGYISYNGRIWEGTSQEWSPNTRCLFGKGY